MHESQSISVEFNLSHPFPLPSAENCKPRPDSLAAHSARTFFSLSPLQARETPSLPQDLLPSCRWAFEHSLLHARNTLLCPPPLAISQEACLDLTGLLSSALQALLQSTHAFPGKVPPSRLVLRVLSWFFICCQPVSVGALTCLLLQSQHPARPTASAK